MNEVINKKFTHLKIHTQYSICEGALRILDLAKHCKTNQIKAAGLCDSNNLCGALEFSESIAKSKTQPIIALSTAEAELLACEKGSTELMGMSSTDEDLGTKEGITLKVDATACHAIFNRTGVGRVRHLDVRRLWIQEKAKEGIIRYMRVSRQGHAVDSFTKAATKPEMEARQQAPNGPASPSQPILAAWQ